MVVVSLMLGVGRAGGHHRQRWWGDGVGGGLSTPGVGRPGGHRRRRWWGGGEGQQRWGGSLSPLVVVAVVAGHGRVVDVDGVGSGHVIDAGGGVVVGAVINAGGGLVVVSSTQVLLWWGW